MKKGCSGRCHIRPASCKVWQPSAKNVKFGAFPVKFDRKIRMQKLHDNGIYAILISIAVLAQGRCRRQPKSAI